MTMNPSMSAAGLPALDPTLADPADPSPQPATPFVPSPNVRPAKYPKVVAPHPVATRHVAEALQADPDGIMDDDHDHDHDEHEHHTHAPLSFGLKVANLIAVILPFVGLVAAAVLLWGVAFDWVHLALMAGMYAITVLGITVGFHRQFTHKSFETSKAVRAILGVMGSMAVEGPLIKWVATHRSHHQHSETELDPHSPHLHGMGFKGLLQGLWYAHAGWLFSPEATDLPRYVPDLLKDRVTKFISDSFTMWVAIGLILPAVIGGLVTWSLWGALLGFLWGGLARVFLVHHVTWSINSVCHVWGSREFKSRDESRNNPIFGILAFGEGWHNNHHAFPTSARHGLRWWQFDLSYVCIKALELVGLAWKVRVPALAQMEAKRIGPDGRRD